MPVSPAALQAVLDGDSAEIRNRVRQFLDLPELAPADHLDREAHRAQVLAWTHRLVEEAGAGLGFPKSVGGDDDVANFVAAFETLAFGDLSLLVKCGVQFGLWGGAVLHLGTERHHRELLPQIIDMRLPGCFAMTEAGHGSNVQALRTTATYDHATREIVVHTPDDDAHKMWIGNAARDGRAGAVFAQLVVDGEVHGVHAVVVPLRSEDGTVLPGVRIEDCGPKLGLDGVDNGRIWFDQVRVPVDNLLDRYGKITDEGTYESPIDNPTKRFFTMLGTLVQGRVSVGGGAMNATKVAQVIAIRHALQRRQFGRPGSDEEALLLDYRTHQRRLLPDIAHTYALHFTQDELRGKLHDAFHEGADPTERERRELETLAAGVKAISTWHATRTIQECREACGGLGYLRSNRFAALKADTDVFTTFEGDNTVLLQLVAKNLLTDYKDQFGELDPLGTARFFAGVVFETVAEKTAVREILNRLADDLVPGRDDEADLCERETQLELMAWRYEHLRGAAARRLKGGIDAGTDPFDVLVDCQDHVVEVAKAWVDLQVLEAFARKVAAEDDPAIKKVLDRLCSLHALSRIEATRAFYQEHGKLSSTRSKAVIKKVNDLCGEVREDAALLVEAYGVPEGALGDARRVPDATAHEPDTTQAGLRAVA